MCEGEGCREEGQYSMTKLVFSCSALLFVTIHDDERDDSPTFIKPLIINNSFFFMLFSIVMSHS